MSNDAQTPTEQSLPKNFRYRDENGKMISLEEAKKRRLAYKDTGLPTKIYQLRMEKKEAEKNGEDVPIRSKKTYEAGSQTHNDVPSPYDLNRRSGYGIIWKVLAEHVNEFVDTETLIKEVNDRFQSQFPEWYNSRYSDENPYDVEQNAYVMTRAPYNAKIEAMGQRVIKEDEGFKLMTNVTEPRKLKKRGRKPKKQETVVETDDESSVEVSADETVTTKA